MIVLLLSLVIVNTLISLTIFTWIMFDKEINNPEHQAMLLFICPVLCVFIQVISHVLYERDILKQDFLDIIMDAYY